MAIHAAESTLSGRRVWYNRSMAARRTLQTLLALALCLVLAVDLGGLYFAIATGATVFAVMTGVYITLALAVGMVWPVIAIAWIVHTTNEIRLRSQAATGRAATAEPDGACIEDP